MLDIIIDLLKDNLALLQNGAIGAIVLGLLKFLPNDKLYAFGNGVGTMITLGLSKFSLWDKVEEWFINGGDVVWQGLVHGLRSDNSEENAKNRD